MGQSTGLFLLLTCFKKGRTAPCLSPRVVTGGVRCLVGTRRPHIDHAHSKCSRMHLQCKYIEICVERGGGFFSIYNS